MRRCKEDAEITRQNILLAAELVFSMKGVQNSSLEQIARQAGVTRGAIYWHFKDKSDVLQALREKFRPPQDELAEEALSVTTEDVFNVFERSASRFLRLFVSDASRQRIYLILASELPDASVSGTLNTEAQEITQRLMERAHATGILANDITPYDAALLLAVVMKGLLTEWLITNKSFDLESAGMLIIRRQLRGLRKA